MLLLFVFFFDREQLLQKRSYAAGGGGEGWIGEWEPFLKERAAFFLFASPSLSKEYYGLLLKFSHPQILHLFEFCQPRALLSLPNYWIIFELFFFFFPWSGFFPLVGGCWSMICCIRLYLRFEALYCCSCPLWALLIWPIWSLCRKWKKKVDFLFFCSWYALEWWWRWASFDSGKLLSLVE